MFSRSLSSGGTKKGPAAKGTTKAKPSGSSNHGPQKNNSSGQESALSKQRTQHRSLVTIVHTKTLSLAKTVAKYPRKHRDLSSNGVLNEAVEALEEFKDVEWPPKRAEMEEILGAVPGWMGGAGDEDGGSGDNKEIARLASDLERQVAVSTSRHSEQSTLSASVTSEGGGGGGGGDSAASSTHGKKVAAAAEVVDGVMDDADVDDDDEVEILHQEVLNAKVDNDTTEKDDEGEPSENGEMAEKGNDGDKEANKEEADKNSIDEDEKKKAAALKRFEAIVSKEKPMETPQSPPASNLNRKSNNNKSKTNKQPINVDAAAMEPMHPAVITTLHALCMVISSESKTHKMAETALECIAILTNGRYVSGVAGGRMKLEVQRKMGEGAGAAAPDATTTNKGNNSGHDGRDGGLSFLGYVVESITRASDSSSETVQSCMAKALLAIMTCPKCGVHEAAMLQAVRSTFHVYLVGKSASGKELAKRTLVDMLKCVFMRMEAFDIVAKELEEVGDGEEEDVDVDEPSKEEGQTKIIAIAPSKSGEDDGTVGTETTATSNGTSTTAAAGDDPAASTGTFASQYHTDSYLLFRALCKLSSKTLPGDEHVGMVNTTASGGLMAGSAAGGMGASMSNYFSSQPIIDPLALNSKILSLELILAVFEHCGDAFINGEKFVYAVQSYLCVSLLKNCMSNQTVVAHLSLKIFLLLVSYYMYFDLMICLCLDLSSSLYSRSMPNPNPFVFVVSFMPFHFI